jgi:hypothetical protein
MVVTRPRPTTKSSAQNAVGAGLAGSVIESSFFGGKTDDIGRHGVKLGMGKQDTIDDLKEQTVIVYAVLYLENKSNE